MEYAWWLMTAEGAITEADYPNQSHLTNQEYDCRFNPDQVIGKMAGWGTITGKEDNKDADITTVKHYAQNYVMSVAVDGS